MPASYPVTVYFYTGFNVGNVPAEASILESAQHKDYDAVFKFQSRDNATIRLNAEWAEIKDADYLKLSVAGDLPVYYVVNQVIMLSAKTAEMHLTMDPLLSCGGVSALTVVDGWESRAHVGDSEDGLFENILPEPWAPMNHLRILADPQEINPKPSSDKQYLQLVASTINLAGMTDYAATVLTSAENPDASVVIPSLKPLEPSQFTEVVFDGEGYTLPGLGLYFMPTFYEEIAAARQIGVESALTSTFVIPSTMVEVPVGSPYQQLVGKVTDYDIVSGYQYGTVKNKKALALYNTYALLSAASGSVAEFEASELYSGSSSPSFRVKIDPSPTGTAYCQPTYYEGRQVKRLEHSVAGMPWLSAGMIMAGASGGALTVANAGRANKLVDHNLGISAQLNYNAGGKVAVSGASGTLGDVVKGVGAVLTGGLSLNVGRDPEAGNRLGVSMSGGIDTSQLNSGIGTSAAYAKADLERLIIEGNDMNYQAAYKMGDNMFNAQVSANVVAPEIRFPVSVNNAAYFGNSFLVYHIGLSTNDLNRLDKFLTMFGYAVDRPLAKAHLTNRTHFNYIKTTDAHFKAPAVSMTMLTQLSEMLNRGVRIWHELPNAAAFNDNPAKEGT